MKTFVSVALLAVTASIVQAQVRENKSSVPGGGPNQIVVTNASVVEVGPAAATYIDAADVAAAFEKGGTLSQTPGYKVMAGRRERPGRTEIHTYETDVFYIVDGTATFVTGGTCADAKIVSP